MDRIDNLKRSGAGKLTYRLANATVFRSPDGFHYIDYLDSVEQLSPEVDESSLTPEIVAYLEKQLQSNAERFEQQVGVVRQHMGSICGKRVMDVGCGGGLFLSKLKAEGAHVVGIELSDARVHYARTKHGLEVHKRAVEDGFWKDHASAFDAVTLWDVIEHVNFPEATLEHSTHLLKDGGLMFIDTPCRDGFYHRFGELTYRVTFGKFPTFLNVMYSSHPFGHKQIFSTAEMTALFERAGLEVVAASKFHELSFPYSFYLKKLMKSDALVKLALPVVILMLKLFPVKNKMLVIGRKKAK